MLYVWIQSYGSGAVRPPSYEEYEDELWQSHHGVHQTQKRRRELREDAGPCEGKDATLANTGPFAQTRASTWESDLPLRPKCTVQKTCLRHVARKTSSAGGRKASSKDGLSFCTAMAAMTMALSGF